MLKEILVIDDNPDIRSLVSNILKDQNFEEIDLVVCNFYPFDKVLKMAFAENLQDLPNILVQKN